MLFQTQGIQLKSERYCNNIVQFSVLAGWSADGDFHFLILKM